MTIDVFLLMILPRVVGDMNGEDEYARFRRRQRIHRYHLIGYAVSASLILIGMLLFWR